MLEKFLKSNDAAWRLARTIAQGLIGVLIANMDVLLGTAKIDPSMKPVITAAIMAVLSPVMSFIKVGE